jgi:putative transposase
MLGIGRVVAQNMPHHIVQRGHNKNTVFVENDDYSYNLNTLVEWTQLLSVNVYAWYLMTSHVHLLLDPGDDVKSIGLLMKRLARRQTRYVDKQEHRTGSLWEGHYKMSIVESDSYFLRCCRYIELNPVKGKVVVYPEHYLVAKLSGECRSITTPDNKSHCV